MIYELLYPLRHSASWLGWLNVLRYVPFRAIAATMTATATTNVYDVSVWIDGALVLNNPAMTVQGDSEVGSGGIGFGMPATSSKGAMQLDYIGIGNLVPEPTSAMLLALAIGSVAITGRRRSA